MRRIVLYLVCLLSLAAAPAVATYKDPRLGTYKLWFSSLLTRSWQNHTLTITALGEGRIGGTIVIDANIGPEGRAPMDWERGCTIPFTGTYDGVRERFVFTVKKPGPRLQSWTFAGYLFRSRGGAFAAGTVTIEGKEISGFVVSRDPKFTL